MITEMSYMSVTDRQSSMPSQSASNRETVILVKEPEPDLKPGDIVMHEVGHKKIPVVVREILSVDQLHKCKLFKIFWGYPKEEAKMEKTCPQCGKVFMQSGPRQEYCSVKCRVAAADKKRLERKEAIAAQEGPDDPAAAVPVEETPVMLGEPEAEPTEMEMKEDVPVTLRDRFKKMIENNGFQWPEPEPEDRNIKAVKRLLKMLPQDEEYTLKINLESGSVQLAVTLIGGQKNAD